MSKQEPIGVAEEVPYADCNMTIAVFDKLKVPAGTKVYAEQVKVKVWVGSMPESNGKQNWTVMLYREGESVFDGITIARSEHENRMQYQAERLRFLIGERDTKPSILEYGD